MGFVKSSKKVATRSQESGEFFYAEMLTVYWETKPVMRH